MNQLETLQTIESSNLYSNPSTVNNIGDPFVLLASDGYYYMYCTSSDNGFYCWKSSDLVNWTDKKPAYLKQEDSWGVDCFWAPEVVELDGVYYMYYTAKNKNGSLRIGVATSSSPDGLFNDVVNEPLVDFGYAVLDANVLIDDDNQKYLYYSRDCSENIQGGIHKSELYGVRLNDDMISLSGEPIFLTTPTQTWEMASGNTVWNEGPEVIKHNGTYYLTYSGNYFSSPTYSVGYATSNSPLGVYKKSDNNPILSAGSYKNISGPGHHSFTTSLDGKELFMVYHTHTFPGVGGGNRQVNIDRVLFSPSGELYVNGPTISKQPMPSTTSLTNVALGAQVEVNHENTSLLTDGIFSIHKKNKVHDFISTLDENGQVVITVTLPEKKTISSILVYRGVNQETDFITFDLIIDNKYSIEGCDLSSDKEQRAAVVSINPVSAQKMKFILYPKDNSEEISLSEINILGY